MIQFDPDQFDTFWAAYPRKCGRGQARRAWLAAGKKVSDFAILAALELQRRAGVFDREPRFIPHASTWLNGERWSDEIVPSTRAGLRNGAAELLLREAEAWPLVDAAVEPWSEIEGPAGD
jgi:hypothetical protein